MTLSTPSIRQRELVATEARGGVGAAQACANARRDLDEQRITGGVAERVVDAFEIVDVEEDDRDARGALRAAASSAWSMCWPNSVRLARSVSES